MSQDEQQQKQLTGAARTEKKAPLVQSAFEVDSAELAKKRQGYYDGWRALTKEEGERVKREEEEEKKTAADKLGLAKNEPKSEAEKKDREKREALREAKKLWDGRKAVEEEQKFAYKNQTGVTKMLKKEDIAHRPVLVITDCKNCKLTLSEDLGTLIKVFIDSCEGTEVILKCPLITQHLEISHSENMTLIVAIPTETIQVDLCDGVVVRYSQNCLKEGHKLYHAGVKRLEVHHFDSHSTQHDYSDLEKGDENSPMEERQFLTHLKGEQLLTERVRHASGIMPLTDAELSKVAGDEEILRANLRQAQTKKVGGNEAFALGEHLQAAVFYTQAMQLAPSDNDLLCVCLSNRAACNLKLGRLEEALDDAVACLAINSKYTKAWFRKGIALHAMKNYGPAIEALSEADRLEPKNKQIQEALGFAKVLLAKQQKEAAENM